MVTHSSAEMHFAPVLTALYLPILILAFIHLAQHWISFARPDWRWLPPATGMVTSLIALVILNPLLGTSPLISVSEPSGLPISAREAAEIQRLVAVWLNWLWIGIMLGGAIYAWRLVWIVWQSLPKMSRTPRANDIAHT